MDMLDRKLMPLPGHKSGGMRTCHRAYCECGWASCAHWERSQAWGEWREHVRSHGAEYEPWEKTWARRERTLAKMRKA